MSASGWPSNEDLGVHQAAWTRVLVGALVSSGARRAVVSPGSRSTPLVLALLAHAGIDRFDVVDERVAGFVALGLARVEGIAPLLVCTSGSAVANWHPAVVEADVAGLPLILLSADRPHELSRSGANQTIEQAGLFGAHVRASFDLDPGPESVASLEAASRLAVHAWWVAHRAPPGPVQLNVRLRKPLEPRDQEGDKDADRRSAAVLARVPHVWAGKVVPDSTGLDVLAERMAAAKRPLIVGGPRAFAAPKAVAGARALARATAIPAAVDPGSWLHATSSVLGFNELLLGSTVLAHHQPDLVLQLGPAPTSSRWEQHLARWEPGVLAVAAGETWADPSASASLVIGGDPGLVLAGLATRLARRPIGMEKDWLDRLGLAAATFAATQQHEQGWSEVAAVDAAASSLPRGGLLVLGNSLAIRHAGELGIARARGIAIATQRGASGIDGLIAGAAGAARAWFAPTAAPTLLVLGDLSAVHDLGGLAAAAAVVAGNRLVVLVLDNGGGRIFERLPVRGRVESLAPWVLPGFTPDLVAVATALGAAAQRVGSSRELTRALRTAWAPDAESTVQVIVAEVPPEQTAERARRVFLALEAQLGTSP